MASSRPGRSLVAATGGCKVLDHVERNEPRNGQRHDLSQYKKLLGRKVHIRVHWDRSYPEQSSARLDVWDGAQWQLCATLLPQTVVELDDAKELVEAIAFHILYDPAAAALDAD